MSYYSQPQTTLQCYAPQPPVQTYLPPLVNQQWIQPGYHPIQQAYQVLPPIGYVTPQQTHFNDSYDEDWNVSVYYDNQGRVVRQQTRQSRHIQRSYTVIYN